MLRKVLKVKQIAGEPRRRWFASPTLDLFLWYDENDNLIQFQICYDKGPNEHALTWHYQRGLVHYAVDDGENRVFHMISTPIMTNEEEFDAEKISASFEKLAGDVEHKIVQFVLSRINPDHEK